MRITVMTILLVSAAMAAGEESLEASPGVLWEYALTHSDMMHSMENLIVSSDMTREASGRLPDPSLRFGWSPLPLNRLRAQKYYGALVCSNLNKS